MKEKDKLKPCQEGGLPGLVQAEQYCTIDAHIVSCLYSTPGASLASVEVLRIHITISILQLTF